MSTTIGSNFYPQGSQGMSPDEYLKKYSQENNISEDEAKTELQSQYGTPQMQSSANIFSSSGYFSGVEESSSTTSSALDTLMGSEGKSPDDFLQEYAEANGLTETEAKAELQEMYGDPEKQPEYSAQESDSSHPRGSEGMDANTYVQNYADDNGMTYEEAETELNELYGDAKEQATFDFSSFTDFMKNADL